MTLQKVLICFSVLLAFGIAGAAEPVGKITSADSFQLRGQTVNVAGVPTWSVLAGDEIVAGAGSLMVVFNDGSKAVIAAKSRAKVEKKSDQVEFRLVDGLMTVTRSSKSPVKFFGDAREVVSAAGVPTTVAAGRMVKMSGTIPPPPPPPTPPPGTPGPTSTR
jgi:hypothetical protein